MKKLMLCCAALVVALPVLGHAAETAKTKEQTKAGSGQQQMDPKAMEEMMMKASMPGPEHALLKKLEGEWDLTVKWTMDPSQPMQETKSTSVVQTLMDGRYFQEQSTGEMNGKPFTGMGLTGYDNVLKKYVSIWIDNMGTGIMKSEGTAAADGKTINWSGESADAMTGKMSKFRMVSTFVDDNHHVFDMYQKAPNGKEMKMMSIDYARKM